MAAVIISIFSVGILSRYRCHKSDQALLERIALREDQQMRQSVLDWTRFPWDVPQRQVFDEAPPAFKHPN
jgi:hypothetical protein